MSDNPNQSSNPLPKQTDRSLHPPDCVIKTECHTVVYIHAQNVEKALFRQTERQLPRWSFSVSIDRSRGAKPTSKSWAFRAALQAMEQPAPDLERDALLASRGGRRVASYGVVKCGGRAQRPSRSSRQARFQDRPYRFPGDHDVEMAAQLLE